MNKRQFWLLFGLVLILSILLSGCSGMGRIDSFIQNGEYLEHSKLIDFGLFFTIFFAMCYLALTMVWGKGFGKPGEGKGAIVALSFALALAFAFALITQTQFSITTIFPLAKAFFFLIIFFILYGLIVKTKIFGEHWGGKIAAAILAAMLVYILLSIFTHMVCQMGNNMNDPACDSEFFNAIFTLSERWFDWDWGPSGPGSTRAPSGSGTADQPPAGPVQGGCRLDLLFEQNSAVLQNPSAVQVYGERAKALGAKVIYANGFASREGDSKLNVGLAARRAFSVMGQTGITTIPMGHGATSIFGSSLEANRRVVLTTEAISQFAPGVSGMTGCELEDPAAGEEDKDKEKKEEGAGEGDATQQEGADNQDEGFNKNWLWLLLLLLPLIWWLLSRKKKGPDRKKALAMKDHFLKELNRIYYAKRRAWEDIMTADTSTMGDAQVETKAKEIITMLDDELTGQMKWVPLRKLASRYSDNYPRIRRDAQYFNRDKIVDDQRHEKHIDLIIKILREFKRRHGKDNKLWKALMSGPDAAVFNSRLIEIVKDEVHGNKLKKEAHVFFMLQMKLRKTVIEFSNNEEKILVNLRKTYSQRRFPAFWKRRQTDTFDREITTPDTTFGLVQATTQVRNLCQELLAIIQEVLDEEQNVTHHVGNWPDLSNPSHTGKFDREKQLIQQLINAINIQKRMMNEDWEPIIDDITPANGNMKGYVRYTRIRANP